MKTQNKTQAQNGKLTKTKLTSLIACACFLFGIGVTGCSPMGDDPIEDTRALRAEQTGLFPGDEASDGIICGNPETYVLYTSQTTRPVAVATATLRNTSTDLIIDFESQSDMGFTSILLQSGFELDRIDPEAILDASQIQKQSRRMERPVETFRMVVPLDGMSGLEVLALQVNMTRLGANDSPARPLVAAVPGMKLETQTKEQPAVFEHVLSSCKVFGTPSLEDSKL